MPILNFDRAMVLLLIISLFLIIRSIYVGLELEKEAKVVLERITDGRESLLNANELDVEKARQLEEMDYKEMKSRFSVRNDFCIYFEDSAGNLEIIDSLNVGIGSDRIYINGQPCN
jgi:hypothetical protein